MHNACPWNLDIFTFGYLWHPLKLRKTSCLIETVAVAPRTIQRVPTGRFVPSLKAAWNKRLSGFNAKNPTFNGSPTFVYNGGEVLAKLQVMAKQCWVCFEVSHNHVFSLDRKHPKKRTPMEATKQFHTFKYIMLWEGLQVPGQLEGSNNGHKQ